MRIFQLEFLKKVKPIYLCHPRNKIQGLPPLLEQKSSKKATAVNGRQKL